MSSGLLVYGATGFVGENVAREAARLGLPPIVAGRDASRLASLAKELGVEHRVFGGDDPSAVERALKDVAAVMNCSGPFKYTSEAIANACLNVGVHYLDITGEIPVFGALQAKDAKAKARGVMLLPGAGFDVVAPDCLALHLKERLPTATRLTLAFQTVGPAGLPSGTQRTAIELLRYGDRVRSDGKLAPPKKSGKKISVDFGEGRVLVELVPWGDVLTAHFATGIPIIETYVAARSAFRLQMAFRRALAPLSKFKPVRDLLLNAVRPGPGPHLRTRTSTHVWGEVIDAQGRHAASRLHGPEAGVVWTASAAVGAARKALAGAAPAGYQTPASAYGADFVLECEGVTREDVA